MKNLRQAGNEVGDPGADRRHTDRLHDHSVPLESGGDGRAKHNLVALARQGAALLEPDSDVTCGVQRRHVHGLHGPVVSTSRRRGRRYPRAVCGIGGTAGNPPDPELLTAMASTMAKRGPDGQRIWHDERVGFAFRRLAIIDLHERSSQPQHFGPLHLVFNGEIYNYRELRDELRALGHRFETEGDAEVLVHAWSQWGEQTLDRVNGMFALALWDDGERRLTLATDPFGEKPLYYALVGDRIVWASEIKALLQDPQVSGRPDDLAVAAFVARGVMPKTNRSFFEGIERLPAAHVLVWRDGVARVRRYWRPQRLDVPEEFEHAAARLRELLVDSIRLRLRSDVPVGTLAERRDRLGDDRDVEREHRGGPHAPRIHGRVPRLRA